MEDSPSGVTIEGILGFWFDGRSIEDWFTRNPDFDRACRERLAEVSAQAASGALDHWRDDPAGCVALCILLDQVPRNTYRDDARAFATDAAARAITSTLISATLSGSMWCSATIFIIAERGAWLSASIGNDFMPQSRMR